MSGKYIQKKKTLVLLSLRESLDILILWLQKCSIHALNKWLLVANCAETVFVFQPLLYKVSLCTLLNASFNPIYTGDREGEGEGGGATLNLYNITFLTCFDNDTIIVITSLCEPQKETALDVLSIH